MKANSGKVWFDDLTLEELDGDGKVKRVIWEKNLTGTRGWYFWNKDGKGGAVRSENGHGDGASIVAAGTVGDANLGADVLRFRTAPGATYRLSGWMRGEKVPPTATCQIRLDFFSSRAPVQDERSRVRRAGDRRLRRVGQAREGAAVPRGDGARSASASTTIAAACAG